MAALAQKREPLRAWELGTIENSLGIFLMTEVSLSLKICVVNGPW